MKKLGIRILAVGAHPADVAKRAGGTVVQHVKEGHEVFVACLSYGETLESQLLWKKPDITIDKIKRIRRKEFLRSAKILGVEPIMLEFDDNFPIHPLTDEKQSKIAEMIRKIKPHIIITHWLMTLYDDHRLTSKALCYKAGELAANPKKLDNTGLEAWKVQNTYFYEPAERYASVTGFLEDTYIDVSDVWSIKIRSLEPFWNSQRNNLDYYTQTALYNGFQSNTKYAERFIEFTTQRVYKTLPTRNTY